MPTMVLLLQIRVVIEIPDVRFFISLLLYMIPQMRKHLITRLALLASS